VGTNTEPSYIFAKMKMNIKISDFLFILRQIHGILFVVCESYAFPFIPMEYYINLIPFYQINNTNFQAENM